MKKVHTHLIQTYFLHIMHLNFEFLSCIPPISFICEVIYQKNKQQIFFSDHHAYLKKIL